MYLKHNKCLVTLEIIYTKPIYNYLLLKKQCTTIYNYLQSIYSQKYLHKTYLQLKFVNNNEQKPYLHIWKPLIGKIIFWDIVCLIFWKTSNLKVFFPNVICFNLILPCWTFFNQSKKVQSQKIYKFLSLQFGNPTKARRRQLVEEFPSIK